MYGLECQNAFDNDPTTHWIPASSWQQHEINKDGKLSYSDHETEEMKRGEEIQYTLLLDQSIGLKHIILQQFNIGHGFTNKIRCVFIL